MLSVWRKRNAQELTTLGRCAEIWGAHSILRSQFLVVTPTCYFDRILHSDCIFLHSKLILTFSPSLPPTPTLKERERRCSCVQGGILCIAHTSVWVTGVIINRIVCSSFFFFFFFLCNLKYIYVMFDVSPHSHYCQGIPPWGQITLDCILCVCWGTIALMRADACSIIRLQTLLSPKQHPHNNWL